MDKENWDEHRFDAIKSQMTEFLTSPEVDFDKSQIDFIPISGLTGNNVVKRFVGGLVQMVRGPDFGRVY